MRSEFNCPDKDSVTLVANMQPLKLYRITEKSGYDGEIVYRPHADFGLLISLSDPEKWWTWEDGNDKHAPTFVVELLPKGASITITQE